MNYFHRQIAIVTISLFAAAAYAQSTATLSGTVTDPSGAVVPQAQVTVRGLATGVNRVVTSDAAGNYTVPSLQPGSYSVSVQATGLCQLQAGQRDPAGRPECDRERKAWPCLNRRGRTGGGRSAHPRCGDHDRRSGDRPEDGAGDSAQWPALSRPDKPDAGHSRAAGRRATSPAPAAAWAQIRSTQPASGKTPSTS